MKFKRYLNRIVFIIGLLICIYPLVSSLIDSYYQKQIISTYKTTIENTDKEQLEKEYNKAEEYNSALLYNKNNFVNNDSDNILSEDNYNNILNIGNGVMGSIEIPKINVNIPIYHGTSDEVLSIGVGHLYNTSFPIGGNGTKSVLTGHRGLPNAKLFTRLDEIVIGDLFFIKVQDKTLAYKVNEIVVIKPEEVEILEIIEDKDLVSLITCTPYGINTHRLVVTGERVPYVQSEYENIESNSMSRRELIFVLIPFIFLLLYIILNLKNRNRKER